MFKKRVPTARMAAVLKRSYESVNMKIKAKGLRSLKK